MAKRGDHRHQPTSRIERTIVAVLATYALVLQVLLGGVAVGAMASPFDTAFAICESGAAHSDQVPGQPGQGHGLDQCCLGHCTGTAAAPPTAPASAGLAREIVLATLAIAPGDEIVTPAAHPPLGSRAPPAVA